MIEDLIRHDRPSFSITSTSTAARARARVILDAESRANDFRARTPRFSGRRELTFHQNTPGYTAPLQPFILARIVS